MFNLTKSRTYKALKYPIWFVIPAQIIFAMLAMLFLLFFIFPKPQPAPTDLGSEQSLGLFLIVATVNIWLALFWMFYSFRLKRAGKVMPLAEVKNYFAGGADLNIAEFLDFESAKTMERAVLFAVKKRIALSPMVVLYALLKNRRTDFIFNRLLVNKQDFEKSIEVIVNSQYRLEPGKSLYQEEFRELLKSALDLSAAGGFQFITLSSIFSAAVLNDKTVQRIFFDFGVRKEDVLQVADWEERYSNEYLAPKRFLSNFQRVRGLADDWAYGYTPTLNAYSKSIFANSVSSAEHMHILARTREVDQLETILAKSGKNNAILVGEPGVGRKSVILGLAQRIFDGEALEQLRHKRMARLDMNMVLAKSRDQASSVDLLNKILSECLRAGNVILVVENFHDFIGHQRREEVGALDISEVIAPYLKSELFQLIAFTNNASYHSNIEAVSTVSVLLEKIDVPELDESSALLILEDMVPKLERRHGLFLSYYALFEIVNSASSFIQNIPFPAKAVDLLSEVLSYVSGHKLYGRVVTQDHVTEIVSQKTGIPLGRVEGEEKAKLLNMEILLHQKIIGQDEAITQIATAMRRIRAGIKERKKPIGTFLFLGPTGVGKTETAKALADVYFGSEERMIRLDMTEYQGADSVNRLIGNIDTNTEAQFADKIREHPFSLVVLDELEKAHPNVVNLFLQVLDEGRLTDAFQRKVSFRNTIIIATSNAGAEFIREYTQTGQNLDVIHGRLMEYLMRGNIFKPEFLNRFDAVIVFQPLKPKEVRQIAVLMLKDLNKRLDERGYKLQINEDLIDSIAQEGHSMAFGARELRRVIQEKIENRIAERIIKGEYKEGDTITLTEGDI